MIEEDLGLKKVIKDYWKEMVEDKPTPFTAEVKKSHFRSRLGTPPSPKPIRHGPWAPGQTKPTRGRTYYEH